MSGDTLRASLVLRAPRIAGDEEAQSDRKTLRDRTVSLDFVPLPAWIKSLDRRFVCVNRIGSQMLGAPQEELIHRDVEDFYPTPTVALDHLQDLRAINERRAVHQVDWVHGNGYWCQRTKLPVVRGDGDHGDAYGVVGVARIVRSVDDLLASILAIPLGRKHLQLSGSSAPDVMHMLGIPQSTPVPSWLQRLRRAVPEPSWVSNRIESLADAAGHNVDYFSRLFTRHFGLSPVLHRRRLQLSRAVDLLLTTRCTLSEIAAECAFSDQSHLTHAFGRVLGETPALFRSKLRDLPRNSVIVPST